MLKLYEPDTKFNKLFMFIGNSVTIFTGIVTIILWIISLVSDNFNNLPKSFKVIFQYCIPPCIIIFILGIIIIIIRILHVGIKAKSSSFYMQRKLTEFLHKKLIHRIRNNIVELEPIERKVIKYAQKNNTEAISESFEHEINILKKNIKYYIDTLSDYLSQYRNTPISVCLKIFRKRDKNSDDYLSKEILTFVRSSNTEKERLNDKITIVSKNTDFTNLCRGQNIFFGSSNLQKIQENGLYINDSDNYKYNKYRSTLVTPVRYYDNSLNNNLLNNNIKPDIIGFLCIDSKEEILEWEKQDSFELQLLATFSDILYVYIKEFYRCFENVEFVNGGILK